MLVNLGVISLNELVNLLHNLVLVCLNESILLYNLSFIVLIQIEIALQ